MPHLAQSFLKDQNEAKKPFSPPKALAQTSAKLSAEERADKLKDAFAEDKLRQ